MVGWLISFVCFSLLALYAIRIRAWVTLPTDVSRTVDVTRDCQRADYCSVAPMDEYILCVEKQMYT